MGYPYQLKPDQRGQTALLIAMIPLAVINLFLILPHAHRWIGGHAAPQRMLLAPLVCIAVIVLVMAQAILLVLVSLFLWRFVRSILDLGRAEADAAFADADPARSQVPTPAPFPEPPAIPDETAAVLVEWIPDRNWARAAGSFDIYVDDRPVWTVTGERVTPILVQAGRRRIFIKVNHLKSDEVEVELAAEEIRRLACGMKPLVRNPLFKFFQAKFIYIAFPVAIVCFLIPDAQRFVTEHFGVELLAIIFLGLLGFYASLPRYFSRRAGAMVYLVECPNPGEAEGESVPEGSTTGL